jgi:RNA polymerase sigma-70 factor (ECF subfamily)
MGTNSLLRTDREFTSVYNRNIKRVYQICFLYLKSHHDAEDASQSIFEKYINLNKYFDDENYEKAWFITVSKNFCKDELKKFWKKKRVDFEEIEAISDHEDSNTFVLIDALLNLPSKYKDVLYLYYVEGYSAREISQLLHRNESTLRSHLSTGRKLLKIDLGGNYEK